MAYAVYMVPCQSFMAFMSAADMEIDTFMHGKKKKKKFQYWYFIGILMRNLKVYFFCVFTLFLYLNRNEFCSYINFVILIVIYYTEIH